MILTLEEVFAVLDEDWLYDLLPGNGQDDYILDQLRKRFREVARGSGSNAEATLED